jgi:hypothetical protein
MLPQSSSTKEFVIKAGHPPIYQAFGPRASYEAKDPIKFSGQTLRVRLGDIVLARSGDKGSNLNIGLFVDSSVRWNWLRSYLTITKMQELVGEDWKPEFSMERVEFPRIFAVHFVIYGILGRGVSSSTRLDGFGKGFADYIRNKIVDVPMDIVRPKENFLSHLASSRI